MIHVGNHLRLLQSSERTLQQSLDTVARRHHDQPDVPAILKMLAQWSGEHAEGLDPVVRAYPGAPATSTRLLAAVLFKGRRTSSIGLLRDLQDLLLLVHTVHGHWSVVDQVAAALRDDRMKGLCDHYISQTLRQMEWIDSRIKELAPQAMTVSP